jgi:hypothetical protein
LGRDVFVLATVRLGVHDAEHAQPVPLTPVPQPVRISTMWPWASARGRFLCNSETPGPFDPALAVSRPGAGQENQRGFAS